MAAAFFEYSARPLSRRPRTCKCRLAMGTAYFAAFKVLARYTDLVQLRWDECYCWVLPLFVRFVLESRMNEQHVPCFLDVARPLHDSQRVAYHAIVEIRELLGRTGFVLPHIDPNGVADTARPGKYARHLRHALVNYGMGQAGAGARAAGTAGTAPASAVSWMSDVWTKY